MTPVDRIYIVMGQEGEYSDRCEWPVAAYHNEDAAKRHVMLAEAEAQTVHAAQRAADDSDDPNAPDPWDERLWINKYDPDRPTDYHSFGDGRRYYCMAVPIRDAVAVA